MSNNEATETDKALAVIEAAQEKFGPIYLGGSRKMHELAGDGLLDEMLAEFRANPAKDKGNLFVRNEKDIISSMMIPIKEDTDYDYYAKYSLQFQEFLLENEFEPTDTFDEDGEAEYNPDSLCVTILQRGNVQIVLRTDAELYRTVFNNIDPQFYKLYLWKSSGEPTVVRENIQMIMNMLFTIAQAAQNMGEK